jgi:hypothetical protein
MKLVLISTLFVFTLATQFVFAQADLTLPKAAGANEQTKVESDLGLPDPAVIGGQVNNAPKAQQTTGAQGTPAQQPKPSTAPAPRSGPQTGDTYTYTPLLADFPQPDLTGGSNDFAGFFNYIFKLVIGLTGVLAVLMIIIGGIQYVSTDSWSGKDSGEEENTSCIRWFNPCSLFFPHSQYH